VYIYLFIYFIFSSNKASYGELNFFASLYILKLLCNWCEITHGNHVTVTNSWLINHNVYYSKMADLLFKCFRNKWSEIFILSQYFAAQSNSSHDIHYVCKQGLYKGHTVANEYGFTDHYNPSTSLWWLPFGSLHRLRA